MSMPKGFKSENGYGTSKQFEGKTYHEIAHYMKEKGFKMNHSTARNVYIQSLVKVAEELSDLYNIKQDSKDLVKIAINPDFQESVRDFMSDINEERKSKNIFNT
jgi:hypothetical protein